MILYGRFQIPKTLLAAFFMKEDVSQNALFEIGIRFLNVRG